MVFSSQPQPVRVLVVLMIFLCAPVHCESDALCFEAERRALLEIKSDLEFRNNNDDPLSSWGTSGDCCEWRGVRCGKESGRVVGLDLSQASASGSTEDVMVWNLGGKINPSLFELRYLSYLDLSFVWLMGNQIPGSIGNLSRLRYLNLSYTFLGGEIPLRLANLSSLQVLDLGYNHALTMKSLAWVSHLPSLRTLGLSNINLSRAYDLVSVVTRLPSLTNLQLAYCYLRDTVIIPTSLPLINSSTSIAVLDLSNNNFTSSVYRWLYNLSDSLCHLDLSLNQLEGSIPESLGKLTSLTYLDLSQNPDLNGPIPEALGNMTALTHLALSRNNLKGVIPDIFEKMAFLTHLDLRHNMFEGTIPNSVWDKTRLHTLIMSGNNFTGILPRNAFRRLTKLETLDISRNSLGGLVTEAGFSNLSQLSYLDLSHNPLTLRIDSYWIPPFQLRDLYLASCNLGPRFPEWLWTQNNCSFLDISDSGISDVIPDWFWKISIGSHSMNLSNNQIFGGITNTSRDDWQDSYVSVDLSWNRLEGPVQSFLFKVEALDLSGNRFTELNFRCKDVAEDTTTLTLLDVSYNELSGKLHDCWSHCGQLKVLSLTNNKLSGKVPPSIGSLTQLETLQLSHNNFAGELPSSLKNCTSLLVLDLGENKLSGPIPTWIGKYLHELLILSLRSNKFNASIPLSLCHLQSVQLLDLSINDINGNIPNCIGSFMAMKENHTTSTFSHMYSTYRSISQGIFIDREYVDRVQVQWKGNLMEFKSILRFVKSIDLSNNKLAGEIPSDVVELVGLVCLNLSRNKLRGPIPREIGNLKFLDVLDLSRNRLVGQIPPSLAQIDRLNALDLSNNNLSGRIPTSTQLQSFLDAYAGNPELCGAPLSECSPEKRKIPEATRHDKVDELVTTGFYIGIAVGFAAAFWGVCCTLIFSKSFRYAYFRLLNDIGDYFWVTSRIYKAKLLRKLNII